MHPLRLARGSHVRGSGKGCAMNVISWENGDTTITDMPDCSDELLSRVVQNVNDYHCTHRDEKDPLLCPPCSIEVLALAHRTVGTSLDWPKDRHKRLYVELALEQAESVAHLTGGGTLALVRRWLAGDEQVTSELLDAAAYACRVQTGIRSPEVANARTSVGCAADAAAMTDDGRPVSDVAMQAVNAAIFADHAAGTSGRLARAHRIIDRFEELTGVRARKVSAEVTARAVAQMTA